MQPDVTNMFVKSITNWLRTLPDVTFLVVMRDVSCMLSGKSNFWRYISGFVPFIAGRTGWLNKRRGDELFLNRVIVYTDRQALQAIQTGFIGIFEPRRTPLTRRSVVSFIYVRLALHRLGSWSASKLFET